MRVDHASEEDHRRIGKPTSGLADQLQAGPLADPVVDQRYVIGALEQLEVGALVGARPDNRVLVVRNALQDVLREKEVVAVILDEQDDRFVLCQRLRH